MELSMFFFIEVEIDLLYLNFYTKVYVLAWQERTHKEPIFLIFHWNNDMFTLGRKHK